MGVRNHSRMHKWFRRVLTDPLELSINPFHLPILGILNIKVIQIKMCSITQELSQLKLMIDYQARITNICFAKMVISLVTSTVFFGNFRIGISLKRVALLITFRATNFLILFITMISHFLYFLLLDLWSKHMIHNVRDISVFK